MTPFYYIADGQMYRFEDGERREVRSEVRDSYLSEVRRAAERNEWKYSGEGAAFTGAYRPGMGVEERMRAVKARINCLGEHGDGLIYSMDMGGTGGLYRTSATDGEGGKDGIVLCQSHTRYGEFDILGDYMTYTAAFGGESHIGILNIASKSSQICTEGHVVESSPVFCASDPRRIYFCSAGLPRDEECAEEAQGGPPPSYADMVQEMYDAASYATVRGPSALCVLDLSKDTVEEVLYDGRYDYLHPKSTEDGTLFYIRRPYQAERQGSLGCLADALLFPVRLIGALFGFLNVFSAKYAGKTLSRSDVKRRDERQVRIDGNLIRAERELKANRRRGDEHPGIVPHTWGLYCRTKEGEERLLRRGVCAYDVLRDGTLLVSNGAAILHVSHDGRESCLCRTEGVTFLKVCKK